jgi:hypothetical protein
MIETTDTIEGNTYPLAFRVSQGGPRAPLFASSAGEGVIRVEARAMGGHQKEAVVTEGLGASAWRMVSDEGPILGGSDLAPFPLGFFSAGLQADLLGRISALAPNFNVVLDSISLKNENRYSFDGSFFAGTGRGSTQPARFDIAIASNASAEQIARLLRTAVDASPAIASLRQPLANTFAMYVNGKRIPVEGVHASTAKDAVDPFVAHAKPPHPLENATERPDLIRRLQEPTDKPTQLPSSGSKVEIIVAGESVPGVTAGTTDVETWLVRPVGTRFGLRSDETSSGETGPSGLALLSAAVSFCYLTQLLRYVEYRKHNVRAIRVVQLNPFSVGTLAADGTRSAQAGPVDTHLFLNGDEPDDVMQKLLLYSARTCYLHAALANAFEPEIRFSLNGGALINL